MAIMTHAIVNGHETRRLREIVEVVKVEGDGLGGEGSYIFCSFIPYEIFNSLGGCQLVKGLPSFL